MNDAAVGQSLTIDRAEGQRRAWALERLRLRTLAVADSVDMLRLYELAWKADLDVDFAELLHVVDLRHGGGATSPFAPPLLRPCLSRLALPACPTGAASGCDGAGPSRRRG